MILYIFMLLGGVFCIWAAYTRQEWFFANYRARPFVKLFGEEGARIFYIILGIFIVLISLFLMGYGVSS